MRQMTVLFWKEWHEQRLVLVALLLVMVLTIVLSAASRHITQLTPTDGAAWLCYAIAGWMLGAAGVGAERLSRTAAFAAANPVDLTHIWLIKVIFGLACTGGVVSIVVISTWVCAGPRVAFALVDLVGIGSVSLFMFAASHYCGCWTRSTISAMGLALVLVQALWWCFGSNPLLLYTRAASPIRVVQILMGISGVGIVVLARLRFAATVRGQEPLSRRQQARCFLLPVVIFGVLPVSVGFIVRAVDRWRLDPTDVGLFGISSVSPDGKRVAAAGLVDQRWVPWLHPHPRAVGFSVSVGDGSICHTSTFPMGPSGDLALWSQDSRFLALRLPGEPLRQDGLPGALETVVLDVDSQCSQTLQGRAHRAPLTWLERDRLLVYSPRTGKGCGLSTWNARERSWADVALPERLKSPKTKCLGHTSKPIRAILAVDPRGGAWSGVFLLDPDTGQAESVGIPSGYRPYRMSWSGSWHMILMPDTRQRARLGSRAPLLLDLRSGNTVSLAALLGEAPDGGWASTYLFPSQDDRWLLIVPKAPAKTPAVGWYAVDLASNEVFSHEPPSPMAWGVSMACSRSSVVAGGMVSEDDGAGVIFANLRQPDAGKRVVLVSQQQRATGVAWLNEHEIVLGSSARSSDDISRQLMEDFGRAGVLAVDPTAKKIRSIWAAKGVATQWHFMTWSEWEASRKP